MATKPTYDQLEQRVAELQAIETELKHAKKALQATRNYAESIVETIREPLIVLDAQLRVISANNSFFKTFEVTPLATKDKLIYEIGNRQWNIPRLRELLEEIIPKNKQFDEYEVEHNFETIGYKIMVLNARRLEVEPKERHLILLAIEDVTERKQVERELRDSEARAQALKDQVLNMLMVVSHDLRSPLVSIQATLKLLLRGIYGKMDESAKNTVIDLYHRADKLLGVAEDCLAGASAVAGDIEFEKKVLDLREDIIDPVLEELSGEIEEQAITIDNRLGTIPAHSILVNANKVWLKIVYRNLFRNAIKYGGTGALMAFGCEDYGSYYKLNVYNSGKPIPEDSREMLFTKFHRIGDSGKVAFEGMGLGLYLTRKIIRKHGGDVWYEAKKDGSNFVFTLPRD